MGTRWIIFKDKNTGREIGEITVEGTFEGEIESTKELLAYDNGIKVEDIKVEIADFKEYRGE